MDVWILDSIPLTTKVFFLATFTKNHKFNLFYIIQGLVSKEKQTGYTAILKEWRHTLFNENPLSGIN